MPEIRIKIFNPLKESLFPSSSVLLFGEKEAILVDAQLEKKNALKAVEMVKSSGKDLKYVFVTGAVPGAYFGLDTVHQAFPEAKIVSTAAICYLIQAAKDVKLAYWKKIIKDQAPDQILVPSAFEGSLELEGEKIQVVTQPEDPSHLFLYIPSNKALIGSATVFDGIHPWLSDSPDKEGIEDLIWQIDAMEEKKPELVIPGRYLASDYSPEILKKDKTYLLNCIGALNKCHNSEEFIQYLGAIYPDMPGADDLRFSAQVAYGETMWPFFKPFPPIGHILEEELPAGKISIKFIDNLQAEITSKGKKKKAEYQAKEIISGIYLCILTCLDGSDYTQVQDFNADRVFSQETLKGKTPLHQEGKLSLK